MRALTDSGLAADHPAVVRGGEWLLKEQILDYGDWAFKNREGTPGGWAFEYTNRFYPDIDDTAVVAMALQGVTLPDEARKEAAIVRAVNWIATMQCKGGGWAAFDMDNDQDWINAIPYGDLKAMIDPNTADITARVLEMHGRLAANPGLVGRYSAHLTPPAAGTGAAVFAQRAGSRRQLVRALGSELPLRHQRSALRPWRSTLPSAAGMPSAGELTGSSVARMRMAAGAKPAAATTTLN